MVTSFSVAKKQEVYVEYLKEYCKDRGMSKSFIIGNLVEEWAIEQMEKDKVCTTSTH